MVHLKQQIEQGSSIRSNLTSSRFCKSLNNRVNIAINSNPNQAGYSKKTLKLFIFGFIALEEILC